MNEGPLVSVIIPNYQHASFLKMRIQSVLNQTYQNYELIILDDYSQDNGASRAIIEAYRHDPHVSHIVFNESNSGSPFKQWRKGLELAKGEYVWIAESDDFCLPTFLETLLNACIKNNTVLAFCSSFVTDAEGTPINTHNPFNKNVIMQGNEFIRNHLSDSPAIVNASSVLFKKDIALSINRQYETMIGCGDWLFWIEMAEKGDICYINKALNYFRRHQECTTLKNDLRGNGTVETHTVLTYLNDNRLVSTPVIFILKQRRVYQIVCRRYDCRINKKELLNLWDPTYIHRILLPAYCLCHFALTVLRRVAFKLRSNMPKVSL